jgi:hypothetical protein
MAQAREVDAARLPSARVLGAQAVESSDAQLIDGIVMVHQAALVFSTSARWFHQTHHRAMR